jgi:AraC-like DNA-binding protein
MITKAVEIINSAAIIQGFLLALILFLKKDTNKRANIFLSFLMLACSYAILHSVYISEYLTKTNGWNIRPVEPTIFLIGPLFFFYTKTLIEGQIALTRKGFLHLFPFVFYMFILITANVHQHNAHLVEPFFNYLLFRALILGLTLILGAYYTYKILKMTGLHRKTLEEIYSTIEKISLDWIKNFLFAYLVLIAAVIINFLLESTVNTNGIFHPVVPLVLAVFIYAFGYRSLMQPDIFYTTHNVALIEQISLPAPAGRSDEVKYKNITMSSDEANTIAQKIRTLMEHEKPYLSPDFNLDSLSQTIGVNKNYLSYVLNDNIKSNFFNFVNSYRVEEVKNRLRSGKYDHLTLITIAFESGFNSKATFNAIFKKLTGLTPSQYKNS